MQLNAIERGPHPVGEPPNDSKILVHHLVNSMDFMETNHSSWGYESTYNL